MASKPTPAEAALEGVTHVFLDAGGTVLHPEPGGPEIFRRVLAGRGHRVDAAALVKLLRTPESLVSLVRPLDRERQREYYRAVNARIVEHLGIELDDAGLDEIHNSFEAVLWTPYPDAVAALKVLRSAGMQLGVISNASHRLPEILLQAGVADLFDTVTYSFEAGAEKPDTRIFKRALARAGATEERSVHIGDSYEEDYLGARRAGLHAVLLRRVGEPPEPCPLVRTLEDLPALLGGGRSQA